LEGNGIWFFRGSRRIKMKLSGNELLKAIQRRPLRVTTDIKDIRDYAYVFSLLTDRRIIGGKW
jgi:hypothetical protein